MYARPPKQLPLDTINYEIGMVEHCFQRLKPEPREKCSSKECYVYIECFLLHYRNLVRFFSGNRADKHDLTAKGSPQNNIYSSLPLIYH